MGTGKKYSSVRGKPWCIKYVALWLLLFMSPVPSFAVQVHGGTEGLYVHQMAHLFFSAALVFLLYILHYRPIGTGKARNFFKLSLFFFLIWNINTIVVHVLSLRLPDEYFRGTPFWSQRLGPPITWDVMAYYLGRYDHLLCLPGMYFLMHSLRLFGRGLQKQQDDQALGKAQ